MKKYLVTILCMLLLMLSLAVTAFAAPPCVVDDADLLTDAEEAALTARLEGVRDTYQADVVVVTALTTDGKTPTAYADDYFDENGYGVGENRDGVLLLISMEDRDWWISTSGVCIDRFYDTAITTIGEDMSEDLGAGHYAAAFETFASDCEFYLDDSFPFFTNLLIALAVGFVVALIVTGVMRSQLKSVRPQAAAKEYVKAGSMKVTQANEFFLYRTVNRVKKATESNNRYSSTHVSSSGRTHGGGGGKF